MTVIAQLRLGTDLPTAADAVHLREPQCDLHHNRPAKNTPSSSAFTISE
jgi:hypothetical protein